MNDGPVSLPELPVGYHSYLVHDPLEDEGELHDAERKDRYLEEKEWMHEYGHENSDDFRTTFVIHDTAQVLPMYTINAEVDLSASNAVMCIECEQEPATIYCVNGK